MKKVELALIIVGVFLFVHHDKEAYQRVTKLPLSVLEAYL